MIVLTDSCLSARVDVVLSGIAAKSIAASDCGIYKVRKGSMPSCKGDLPPYPPFIMSLTMARPLPVLFDAPAVAVAGCSQQAPYKASLCGGQLLDCRPQNSSCLHSNRCVSRRLFRKRSWSSALPIVTTAAFSAPPSTICSCA